MRWLSRKFVLYWQIHVGMIHANFFICTLLVWYQWLVLKKYYLYPLKMM